MRSVLLPTMGDDGGMVIVALAVVVGIAGVVVVVLALATAVLMV